MRDGSRREYLVGIPESDAQTPTVGECSLNESSARLVAPEYNLDNQAKDSKSGLRTSDGYMAPRSVEWPNALTR
jgi:hypothetical protein